MHNRLLTIALSAATVVALPAQPYKVMYNLGSNPGDPSCPSFAGVLTQSPGGNLYSAAVDCRTDNLGSAYKIATNGTVTVLHYFTTDGGYSPRGGLILATNQRFCGTTQWGGAANRGTFFKMSPGGTVTDLYSFNGDADGGSPTSVPIQGVSGDFYGTTQGEYDRSWGAIYKITADGTFTNLHIFSLEEGYYSYGPLLEGNDGAFYGVAEAGGDNLAGTIYRITPQGDYTVLHHFDGTHGVAPVGALVQAKDGNFYGATWAGGAADDGVIYRLTPALEYTVLHEFTGVSDGANPTAALVEASDGNFYGTTTSGGAYGHGALFRITPSGAFTLLHNFAKGTGFDPESTMTQHTNGMMYGQTLQGGSAHAGVIYRVNLGLPPFLKFLNVYGQVGAKVVIFGQHFTSATVVAFNGVAAQNPEIHPTYIKAIVPQGATTGPITATTSSGVLTSLKPFVVH